MQLSSGRMLQRIQGLPDSQPFGADLYRDNVMVTWSAPTRLLRVRILFPVPWSDCLMVRHRPRLQLSGRRYCRRPSVSGDLISADTSATGGRQRFAPAGGGAGMCLSVRVALTPPYTQMMQRKTSLSQEQGLAGSNPALRTICTSDATGRHLRLRTGVLRVRVPPCVPFIRLQPSRANL